MENPYYGLQVHTEPTSRPVTLREVKSHLRLLGNDADDEYLDNLIRTATEFVETKTLRTLIPTTYIMSIDQFPYNIATRNIPHDHKRGAIILPRNPVISLDLFTYVDDEGNVNSITNAILDINQIPARVVPARNEVFPFADYYGLSSVKLRFTAGYANGNYPYLARQAIMYMVSHFYELREPVNVGNIVTDVPMTIKTLLNRLKVTGFVR